VEKFLQINQLNVFEFVCSEKNIFNKASKLNHLLKKNKLDPQNVFYIGDETRDMEAAKEVGVKTVAVTWGFNSEKALLERQPDYLIRQPRDLVALLDNF
jgi:phosphoglycolate phosphatase-like HAD superfamily hydrolase